MLSNKEIEDIHHRFIRNLITFDEIKKLHLDKKMGYDTFNHFHNVHELRNMKMK